jgi:hypothetical protein
MNLFSVVVMICRSILTPMAERNAEAQLKLKRKIKKWLRPPDTKEIIYKADLATKSTAIEGTCTWLLSHRDYQRWRSSEHSVLAWLHGIQGSGKSTLVACIISQLQTEGLRNPYLFCRQDADVSPSMLINCLTLQMIKQDSEIINALKPIYEKTVGASLIRAPIESNRCELYKVRFVANRRIFDEYSQFDELL